ncbi:MAG: hypothetical protein NC307_07375 [Roseburia sp.]|nr:hypothetical protein [Roseburia sp.]
MKILNIHGYNGDPANSAYLALREIGCDIISPTLDYDTEMSENIFDRLLGIVRVHEPNVIVGTSLGGFYGALLSVRTKKPLILVNPCLMPFLTLPRLGYKGEIQSYISLFGELSEFKSSYVSAIVGGSDEVIDTHDFTEILCGNPRYKVIPGGEHSGDTLPLKEYFTIILRYMGN